MPTLTRAATARKTSPRAGAPRRARLIRDVETQFCALGSAVSLFHKQSAADRGLTLTDLEAVDILSREGTVCASDLAEQCGLTRGAITGMLDRLERAGVSRRTRDETDGRRLVISAVEEPAGSDCRIPQVFRQVAESFDEDELRIIQHFLKRTAQAIRTEAESMREKDGD
jgi:DNA-binding MarR family transcriptional regulator